LSSYDWHTTDPCSWYLITQWQELAGLKQASELRDECVELSTANYSNAVSTAKREKSSNVVFVCRDWSSRAYLEPPGGSEDKERELEEDEEDVIDDDRRNREASGLVRSGRLFGGLINDIKR
jgi:hypothetical protein